MIWYRSQCCKMLDGLNSMNQRSYEGVGDPEMLRDLLFYLRHVSQPGARDAEPDGA